MKRGTGVEACWMNLYDAGVFGGPPKIYFWGVIGYFGYSIPCFYKKILMKWVSTDSWSIWLTICQIKIVWSLLFGGSVEPQIGQFAKRFPPRKTMSPLNKVGPPFFHPPERTGFGFRWRCLRLDVRKPWRNLWPTWRWVFPKICVSPVQVLRLF